MIFKENCSLWFLALALPRKGSKNRKTTNIWHSRSSVSGHLTAGNFLNSTVFLFPLPNFSLLSYRWAAAVSRPSLLPACGGCVTSQLSTGGKLHSHSSLSGFLSCSSHNILDLDHVTFILNSVLTVHAIKDNMPCHNLLLICLLLSRSSHSTVALPKRCPSTAWIPAVLSAFTPRTRRSLSLSVLLLLRWLFTPSAHHLTQI